MFKGQGETVREWAYDDGVKGKFTEKHVRPTFRFPLSASQSLIQVIFLRD